MPKLELAKIRIDGDIQPREELDQDTVNEYAARMEDGDKFPPVLVYHDGSDHWLVDGFHRVVAYARIDQKKIDAEVRKGTRRDAALAAVSCNAQHGKRRTNGDKRRSVMRLLEDAEWAAWSDREIAKRCGVHHQMVGKVRGELSLDDSSSEPRTYTTKHGTQSTMNTSNIGRSSAPAPADDEYEEVIIDESTGEVIEDAAVLKTKKSKPKTGAEARPVSYAMHFASIAISQLERINSDDPERPAAIVSVQNWITENL